jgi:hypothetical protein
LEPDHAIVADSGVTGFAVGDFTAKTLVRSGVEVESGVAD